MHSYFGITYLIKRAFLLFITFYIFIFFLTSITLKTGGADFDALYLPIIISIATMLLLHKRREEQYIIPVSIAFLLVSFTFSSQGEFLHSTCIGTTAFLWFFNAIRPWQ